MNARVTSTLIWFCNKCNFTETFNLNTWTVPKCLFMHRLLAQCFKWKYEYAWKQVLWLDDGSILCSLTISNANAKTIMNPKLMKLFRSFWSYDLNGVYIYALTGCNSIIRNSIWLFFMQFPVQIHFIIFSVRTHELSMISIVIIHFFTI